MPFDRQRAQRAINFFERVLVHTKGKFAGQPFLLLPWQREIISDIFGTVDEDGNRQYQLVYVEVAKKNGKSELAAGIALYCLVADNEPGAEVYSAAAARDQAGLVYGVAASMIEASPILRNKLRVLRSTLRVVRRDSTNSFYHAIAADGDLQDGINPHCVIADELHRWKVQKAKDLWDVLEKGMVARCQPLMFAITTAGLEDESPLAWRYHEYTRQVNEGVFKDPRFYGRIFAADPKDDWQDPKIWAKANPSLETNGGFLKLSALEKLCNKAVNEPAEAAAFKRYHLDLWGEKENRWMDMVAWKACATETKRLIERPCYAGLDLSSTVDLTSMVLVFPDDDDTFDIVPFFWMPSDSVRKREAKDKVPYSEWIKQGKIEVTEGSVIDVRKVKEKILWAREVFELREVAYDPWHANQIAMDLVDEGIKCVPIRQGYQSLSEPTKKLQELVLQGRIRHGGHPVLSWNADCVTVIDDGNDNIRPVKPGRSTSNKRIDGILASIMGLDRAMRCPGSSVYEERGIEVL